MKKSVRLNNFLGGVTSELNFKSNPPKFARLWNFDVTQSRAIQHGGLKDVLNGEYHIVEYSPNDISLNNQWFMNRHSALAVKEDGELIIFDTKCNITTNTLNLASDVQMETLPIMYRGHIAWLDQSGDVWLKSLSPIGPDFKVLENLDIPAIRNSFFLAGPDGKLYFLTGKKVHRVELPNADGTFNQSSELAEHQPITQYMQAGDRNGVTGTYTGALGPENNTITDIDNVQSILKILGYYESSIDGVFGPATQAAVQAFQADYNATGNVPGGQASGTALVVDGIVGPETQAVLNATENFSNQAFIEKRNVLTLPERITAVTNNGAIMNIATYGLDGNANVYYWDRSLTSQGVGDIGLLTSIELGQGIVQILKPLNGRLMALTSPASDSFCVHPYTKLSIYALQASFEIIPEGFAVPVAQYNLAIGTDGSNFDDWRFNYLNQKSLLRDSRLYFTGKINLQSTPQQMNDSDTFSGIMSIDNNGNLYTELSDSNTADPNTNVEVISFGVVDSGFILATKDNVKITDIDTESVAGFITDIIDDDTPWSNKKIDNLFLALANTAELTRVELWVREAGEKDDANEGWVLAYDGGLDTRFGNRIIINRLEDSNRFRDFRELQIRGLIYGKRCELLESSVNFITEAINE